MDEVLPIEILSQIFIEAQRSDLYQLSKTFLYVSQSLNVQINFLLKKYGPLDLFSKNGLPKQFPKLFENEKLVLLLYKRSNYSKLPKSSITLLLEQSCKLGWTDMLIELLKGYTFANHSTAKLVKQKSVYIHFDNKNTNFEDFTTSPDQETDIKFFDIKPIVNINSYDNMFLWYAVRYGHLHIIKTIYNAHKSVVIKFDTNQNIPRSHLYKNKTFMDLERNKEFCFKLHNSFDFYSGRNDLVQCAIQYNQLEILKYIIEFMESSSTSRNINRTQSSYNLYNPDEYPEEQNIQISEINNNKYIINPNYAILAIKGNSIDVIKYMYDYNYIDLEKNWLDFIISASEAGSLDIIKFLLDIPKRDCLLLTTENNFSFIESKLLENAIKSNTLEMFKFLLEFYKEKLQLKSCNQSVILYMNSILCLNDMKNPKLSEINIEHLLLLSIQHENEHIFEYVFEKILDKNQNIVFNEQNFAKRNSKNCCWRNIMNMETLIFKVLESENYNIIDIITKRMTRCHSAICKTTTTEKSVTILFEKLLHFIKKQNFNISKLLINTITQMGSFTTKPTCNKNYQGLDSKSYKESETHSNSFKDTSCITQNKLQNNLILLAKTIKYGSFAFLLYVLETIKFYPLQYHNSFKMLISQFRHKSKYLNKNEKLEILEKIKLLGKQFDYSMLDSDDFEFIIFEYNQFEFGKQINRNIIEQIPTNFSKRSIRNFNYFIQKRVYHSQKNNFWLLDHLTKKISLEKLLGIGIKTKFPDPALYHISRNTAFYNNLKPINSITELKNTLNLFTFSSKFGVEFVCDNLIDQYRDILFYQSVYGNSILNQIHGILHSGLMESLKHGHIYILKEILYFMKEIENEKCAKHKKDLKTEFSTTSTDKNTTSWVCPKYNKNVLEEIKNSKNIALLNAAKFSRKANVVKILLENGALPTYKNCRAFKESILQKNYQVSKEIIEFYPEIVTRVDMTKLLTDLCLSANPSSLLPINNQIDNSIDSLMNIKDIKMQRIITLLINNGGSILTFIKCQFIAACKQGKMETINNILLFAQRNKNFSQSKTQIQVLNNQSINTNTFNIKKLLEFRNYSCLAYAVYLENFDLCKKILNLGADPTANKSKSLLLACNKGNFRIVELLLENGACPNRNKGKAFTVSVLGGYYEILDILVDHNKVNSFKHNISDKKLFCKYCGENNSRDPLLNYKRELKDKSISRCLNWTSKNGSEMQLRYLINKMKILKVDNKTILWATVGKNLKNLKELVGYMASCRFNEGSVALKFAISKIEEKHNNKETKESVTEWREIFEYLTIMGATIK
ncbi:hypothetical protein BB559_004266 [Furculomyces boomerangus]|uniref:Uncharacterized protein n=1 Tax=Furculomyces boomerangus TaxID=61424 RepID=A0A2T9YFK3_9FUNG|nr:hypothetical protein BB559_004266 [Furculomyces boomerangus]